MILFEHIESKIKNRRAQLERFKKDKNWERCSEFESRIFELENLLIDADQIERRILAENGVINCTAKMKI